MSLSGCCAVVTGATGHLGRVICDTLGELGADIFLVDQDLEGLNGLKTLLESKWPITATTFSFDLESESQRNEMLCEIKSNGRPIDCLINNAAFVGASNLEGWAVSFEEQSLETWRRAIEVNLTAAFHICQGLIGDLRKSKKGNIINVSSIYGQYGPDWRLYEGGGMGNPAAYAGSKGGLLQLTRWLSTTVAPSVRVNAIAPGGILRNQPSEFVRRYVDRTPLARMATEDDFRGAIAYLSTDMSRYVTGQTLFVDGGWGVW